MIDQLFVRVFDSEFFYRIRPGRRYELTPEQIQTMKNKEEQYKSFEELWVDSTAKVLPSTSKVLPTSVKTLPTTAKVFL